MSSVPLERLARSLVEERVGNDVRSVKEIVGRGVMNRVFVVRTEGEALVVRFPADASRDSDAGYRKEAWCIQRASRRGVAAPRVLSVGRDVGRPYMVSRFVEGRTGHEIEAAEAPTIWRTLGRYARVVATVEASGFGPELADPRTGRFTDRFVASWREQIGYHVDSLGHDDPLRDLGVYPPEAQHELRRRFGALRALPWKTALRHGDPRLDNLVVDPSETVHLLDWGHAAVDVYPEGPLATLLRRVHRGELEREALHAFYAGMELQATWSELERRVEDVALLKTFDLVRWSLDRAPELTEECAERALATFRAVSEGGPDRP